MLSNLAAFPQIHSSPLVKRQVVANYSLLYEVQGSDTELAPYMLCAHMDVVPANAANWHHPPFAGQVVDGEIWGRGAIDAKDILMGIMEALEYRLEQGDLPRRGIFLAFGHDEEITGRDGAAYMSSSVVAEMLTALAPEVQIVMSTTPLEESTEMRRFLSRDPHIDPMIRTTTTVTRIHGGIKDNVVPAEAYAYVNHRVHPSQSVAEGEQVTAGVVP
ncbi:hypothetical protein HPB52_012664 [Rhipicephalus sanguineus]|uniref:Peptidase M20 dimerisation domain-containing protein n=1 Tax=Rhipicephalus sanguineus TaxID=34632 RepID=A0A9D4PLI1_RHISA|nr:hypothetical protein HPB52_012664 [Rhipicephalus sanguineus]